MSVSGISGSNSLFQLNQTSAVGQTNNVGSDSDGDNDGGREGRVSGARGGFMSAIMQALSQLGTPSTTATPSSTANDASGSTAADPKAALGAFMHDLFAALQSQDSGQSTPVASDGSTTAPAQGQGHHHHHGGGVAAIEGKLQSLIQQLSGTGSSQPNTNADSTTTANASGTTGADSAVATLHNDFQNLLSSLGISGGQTTLESFLKTVSQNIQGANPGLNVTTQA